MDKIRIGNDIHIEWSIFRDNQPEEFEGKDVEVRLIHTRTRDVIPLEWVISDGVVSATFYGKDQIDTGDYKLMLVENNGAPNMATIDECKAFTLVQCSCQEQKEDPSTSLQLHKVQLTSSFALSGGGNISVEGYPNVDELEEVKELSGNENIIITDSEGNKKTTIGNLKEYVVKDISELPPFRIFETESDYNAVKDELGDCVVCLRDTGVMLYHVYNKTEEGGGEIEDKYIRFADPEVQRILVENFSSDGVGMTSEDIEKVTSIGTVFKGNDQITSFNELKYFENIINFGYYGGGTLNDAAFYNCANLEEITLPPRLNSISAATFQNCTKLRFDLSALPKSIKYIQSYAFSDCANVYGYIDLPELVQINPFCFMNTNVEGVLNLGNITQTSQTYAGQGDFTSSALRFAILPSTLQYIGLGTFANTPSMTALVCKATVPPAFMGGSPFSKCDAVFYVPDASVEAYKTATNWSSFASRIKGISELPIDNPTLYEEIKDYLG